MIIVVDPSSGIPVYRQLMDQVRFHIASGLLRPGDEIPSTRTLSAQLGINPMTISKAFSQLEKEGVLERRKGLPSIVRDDVERVRASKLDELRRALKPVAVMVHQLGIDKTSATTLFQELLDERR